MVLAPEHPIVLVPEMVASGPARFGWVAVAVLAVFFTVFEASLVPSVLSPSTAPVATAGYWSTGDGLLTLSHDQSVTASAYWESYCGTPNPCTVPVGVACVPTSNAMVVTEAQDNILGVVEGADAIVGFNPDTLQVLFSLRLGCQPEMPFYPGSGTDIIVPCINATTYAQGALLGVDTQTGSLVVVNASRALGIVSMTYDPLNGIVYLANSPNALPLFDLANHTVVGTVNVTGAMFDLSYL